MRIRTKTKERRDKQNSLNKLKPLWKYLRPYRAQLLLGLVSLVIAALLTMVTPWVLKLAIDDLNHGVPFRVITNYAFLILSVTILIGCFRYIMRRWVIGVSRKAEYDLRNDLFAHIELLPQEFFHRRRTGDIMSRLTNDVQSVRMVLGPALMQLTNTFFSLVFALIMMIAVDFKLTMIAVLPLPLLPAALYFLGRQVHIRYERVQEQMAAINTQAQENITGMRIVKAYNLQPTEIRKFDNLSREYVRRNMNLIRYRGLFMPLMVLLSGISTIVILFFGGWWVIQERITLGGLVAFMDYLVLLTWPMFAIGWVVSLLQQGAASMGRINAILQESPSLDMLPEMSRFLTHQLLGDIKFKNVWFRYHSDTPFILKNLSLTIKQGELIAIMGPTGIGKTSIFHLLTRTYLPERGTITFNGHEISEIPTYDLREMIGTMPQDLILFSDTIRANLEFGFNDLSENSVEPCSRLAYIDQEIKTLPQGYDTILGERGVNLSGGQKQRLTLARVLARNPAILLLDDPFSSVDIYTEEYIIQQLNRIRMDRTILIISHRVNTARRADRILFFQDGTLAETGSHEELLAHRGLYYQLFQKQQIRDELERM